MRVLKGWGPRWPTAALPLPPLRQGLSVLASAHTKPPGGRQPKPASLQCWSAEPFLIFPPLKQRPSDLNSPSSLVAIDMVHQHGESLLWAFSGWQSHSGAVWW